MKPIWKSRKLVYALGTALASLIITVLPEFIDLDPSVQEMLNDVLPLWFVVGISLILGHTITDVVVIWRGGVQSKPLADALKELVDVLIGALQESRPIENLEEMKTYIYDLLVNAPEEGQE